MISWVFLSAFIWTCDAMQDRTCVGELSVVILVYLSCILHEKCFIWVVASWWKCICALLEKLQTQMHWLKGRPCFGRALCKLCEPLKWRRKLYLSNDAWCSDDVSSFETAQKGWYSSFVIFLVSVELKLWAIFFPVYQKSESVWIWLLLTGESVLLRVAKHCSNSPEMEKLSPTCSGGI